jgi:hypothetical protein
MEESIGIGAVRRGADPLKSWSLEGMLGKTARGSKIRSTKEAAVVKIVFTPGSRVKDGKAGLKQVRKLGSHFSYP